MSELDAHRVKHLEFIEEVISRQAHNSFAIKGWSITLSAGIFTFLLSQDASQGINGGAYLIVLLPTLVFWFLDGFYLWQERAFRCLYDDVRNDIGRLPTHEPVVSLFVMSISDYKKTNSYGKALRSWTVYGIPLMILGASVALFAINLPT